MSVSFKALVINKNSDGSYVREIEQKKIDKLSDDEILIRVHYSSLNYKDGLSCIGNPGVTRRYPHIPGVDAAGVVEKSNSKRRQRLPADCQ